MNISPNAQNGRGHLTAARESREYANHFLNFRTEEGRDLYFVTILFAVRRGAKLDFANRRKAVEKFYFTLEKFTLRKTKSTPRTAYPQLHLVYENASARQTIRSLSENAGLHLHGVLVSPAPECARGDFHQRLKKRIDQVAQEKGLISRIDVKLIEKGESDVRRVTNYIYKSRHHGHASDLSLEDLVFPYAASESAR